MKLVLEIKYEMEDGNEFKEYFPCKDSKKGLKSIRKRMAKEFFEVGPISVETVGIVSMNIKEYMVH